MNLLKSGWSDWKKPLNPDDLINLQALIQNPNNPLQQAMEKEAWGRMEAFIDGVNLYRNHPYQPKSGQSLSCIAQIGASRLLAIKPLDQLKKSQQKISLILPSLVNRYYILDLDEKLSFVRALEETNRNCIIIDWGEPSTEEQFFTLEDYIKRAQNLLSMIGLKPDSLELIGYCMGGLLALALAHHLPPAWQNAKLRFIAIATPYDFHAALSETEIQNWQKIMEILANALKHGTFFPTDLLQIWFLSLDPLVGFKKFIHFSKIPKAEILKIQEFIAREDWLNDGVPLTGPVALEALQDWYGFNSIKEQKWKILDKLILPQSINADDSLIISASFDRLVPLESSLPLGNTLPNPKQITLKSGHVGMMSEPNGIESLINAINLK